MGGRWHLDEGRERESNKSRVLGICVGMCHVRGRKRHSPVYAQWAGSGLSVCGGGGAASSTRCAVVAGPGLSRAVARWVGDWVCGMGGRPAVAQELTTAVATHVVELSTLYYDSTMG